MKSKKNIKLPVTDSERKNLRKHKVKISEIINYSLDELEMILEVGTYRAKELRALAEFQTIPSIGIKFAEDLVFLGFFSIDELKDKDGAELMDLYELKKGFWIDSCVEDQFRLVVYFAKTGDYSKNWWDFTTERKKYRAEFGYPETRPKNLGLKL